MSWMIACNSLAVPNFKEEDQVEKRREAVLHKVRADFFFAKNNTVLYETGLCPVLQPPRWRCIR